MSRPLLRWPDYRLLHVSLVATTAHLASRVEKKDADKDHPDQHTFLSRLPTTSHSNTPRLQRPSAIGAHGSVCPRPCAKPSRLAVPACSMLHAYKRGPWPPIWPPRQPILASGKPSAPRASPVTPHRRWQPHSPSILPHEQVLEKLPSEAQLVDLSAPPPAHRSAVAPPPNKSSHWAAVPSTSRLLPWVATPS
jgi:hypothetical protein